MRQGLKISLANMKEMQWEKIFSAACFMLGTIFLLLSVFFAWRYLIFMGICYLAAILMREDH